MKNIPLKIVTCGDYYLGCQGAAFRFHPLRRICHRMKRRTPSRWGRLLNARLDDLLDILSESIPKGAVIIPVPCVSSERTTVLALRLSERVDGSAVAPVLRRDPGALSLYDAKKDGAHVTEADVRVWLDRDELDTAFPDGIPEGRPVVLLDDVIGTGTTMSACLGIVEAIVRPSGVICACLALDRLTYEEHVADTLISLTEAHGLTKAKVLELAERDGETPFGFILAWMRDMSGLPKRLCWAGARFWCFLNDIVV